MKLKVKVMAWWWCLPYLHVGCVRKYNLLVRMRDKHKVGVCCADAGAGVVLFGEPHVLNCCVCVM